uniref:Oxysterol-binding protein n=1 Tax=Ditylenchus dipsaci TaxID=166011 RepID=A0A915CXJ6_9BILA
MEKIAVQSIKRELPPNITRAELPGIPICMEKSSVWSILKHSIGKDLTHLVIPIEYNEPLSFIQRFADYLENTHIIKEALACEDASERLQYIGAFAVSALDSIRVTKPFNPLLFETYELNKPELGFRFVAEQVSHHPPISAFHASSEDFEFFGTIAPELRFRGFYVYCKPNARLTLKLKKSNDIYTWQATDCMIHNLFIGKMFMSLTGFLAVKYPLIHGDIVSQDGERICCVYGNFTEYLASCPPRTFDSAYKEFVKTFKSKYSRSKLLWRAYRKPPRSTEFYNFTYFSLLLNEMPTDSQKLPRTDSRNRPDMRLMEQGEIDEASNESFASK